jgi:hypothetical protein
MLQKQLNMSTFGVLASAVIGLLWTILLIYNVQGPLLCDLVGFTFPAYASVKAIEKKKDEHHWLA